MTSPLKPYKNARLLVAQPGSRGTAANGYRRTEGTSIVVNLFLKQVSPEKRSVFKDIVNASVATDIYEGYVINHAELPADADWLTLVVEDEPGAVLEGTRPSAIKKGRTVKAILIGQRVAHSVEVIEAEGIYGDAGIGDIVRNVLGDRIVLLVEWSQ